MNSKHFMIKVTECTTKPAQVDKIILDTGDFQRQQHMSDIPRTANYDVLIRSDYHATFNQWRGPNCSLAAQLACLDLPSTSGFLSFIG